MDDIMKIPMDYNQFGIYRNMFDSEFPEPSCSCDEASFVSNDNIDEKFRSFSSFKEEPKFQISIMKSEKKSNSIIKFESHRFFNPKLKDNEQIIIKKKRKPKKHKYFIARKTNRDRKNDKDNIMKKIKSKFFKSIKKILKEKVQIKYKMKKSFKFITQKFISSISIENNKSFWEETLLEFCEKYLSKDNKALELMKEDKIGEITFKDLYNDYLESGEFEEGVLSVKNEENVDQNYIDNYINYAKGFINYFLEGKPKKKKIS